jgi:uncharacterized protein YcfJ
MVALVGLGALAMISAASVGAVWLTDRTIRNAQVRHVVKEI